MNNTVLIFIGAGLRGVLRNWISSDVNMIVGRPFHYGDYIIDISIVPNDITVSRSFVL